MMIHPSYVELMEVVNEDSVNIGEEPVVNSRYSIVIASAKRARQIVSGATPKVEAAENEKALSVAVRELYEQKVRILGEDEEYAPVEEEEAVSEESGEPEEEEAPAYE